MSEGLAFTDLEEGLFGPEGTQVLRRTAGRLVALRADVTAGIAGGLTLAEAETSTLAIAALDAAERILIDLKQNGE